MLEKVHPTIPPTVKTLHLGRRGGLLALLRESRPCLIATVESLDLSRFLRLLLAPYPHRLLLQIVREPAVLRPPRALHPHGHLHHQRLLRLPQLRRLTLRATLEHVAPRILAPLHALDAQRRAVLRLAVQQVRPLRDVGAAALSPAVDGLDPQRRLLLLD